MSRAPSPPRIASLELVVAEELMSKSEHCPVVSSHVRRVGGPVVLALVKRMEVAVRTPWESCKKHPFVLDFSQSSIEQKPTLLRGAGFCYSSLIKSPSRIAFNPGSEFWHILLIHPCS